MGVKVTTEGIDNIFSELKSMGEKANSIVDEALEKAIKPIYDETVRLANKSKSKKHISKHGEGHMADEIPKNKEPTVGTNHSYSIGWDKADNSPHFYAKFIEWGTSNPKYPKRPFMQPALDRKQNEAFEIVVQEIKRGLDL